MDSKIAGISLVMSTEFAINVVGIVVGDPLEWLALSWESKNRICSSFDGCMVPFYECMF